jgi:hypothetical protein
MLPLADPMRPAESDDGDDPQTFDAAAVGDVGVFKVKTSTFQTAKQGFDLPALRVAFNRIVARLRGDDN